MPSLKQGPTGLPVTECIHCGHPARPTKIRADNGLLRSYKECTACQNFKARHGFVLTKADRAMLNAMPYCNICGTDRNLVIDHCHSTNRIRGYLCSKHNKALGSFDDNSDHLHNAIQYLLTSTKPNETTQAAS